MNPSLLKAKSKPVKFALMWVLLLATAAVAFYQWRRVEPAYPKGDLIKFLALQQTQPLLAGEVRRLDPEWIGTVKRVHLKDSLGIYQTDEPDNLRFSRLFSQLVWHNKRLAEHVVIGRIGEIGGYSERDIARFTNCLPATKTVAKFTTLSELESAFGPNQRRFVDGWGGPDGLHTTAGWTFFTKESADRLRFMDVFAHLSHARGAKDSSIDIIEIREGILRPANPDSVTERQQFKTADELENIRRAKRAAERAKYPQPLRSVIEARERPDDHSLIAYARALNQIRQAPDPMLFQQIVERVHEDTVTFGGYLRDILLEPTAIESEPWNSILRQKALRATVDSLDKSKTRMALDDVLMTVLAAQGGGEMRLDVPSAGASIKLKFTMLTNGSSMSYDSSGVTDANLPIVAAECRAWLLKRYPELENP